MKGILKSLPFFVENSFDIVHEPLTLGLTKKE